MKQLADEMIGMTLVTHQTGPKAKKSDGFMSKMVATSRANLYLGLLIDRVTSRVTIMASTEGGMEIEEVAAKTPEKILKVAIDPACGMQAFHARKIAFGLGLEGNQVKSAVKFLMAMYKAFEQLDASIVEINPWWLPVLETLSRLMRK